MDILKKQDVSKILDIDESLIDEFIECGLPFFRIGEEIRFEKVKVFEFYLNKIKKQRKIENTFLKTNKLDLLSIENFSNKYQFSKKETEQLCKNNLLDFIEVGETKMIKDVILMNNIYYKKEIPTFIVDASIFNDEYSCSGVIFVSNTKKQCFSKVRKIDCKYSAYAELLAIYDAALYAKTSGLNNIQIATDQIDYINKFNDKDFSLYSWQKKELLKETFEMLEVIQSLNITFLYANSKEFIEEYNLAHKFSRLYKDTFYEDFKEKEISKIENQVNLIKDKRVNMHLEDLFTTEKIKNKKVKLPKNKIDLEISFLKKENSFVYFNVLDKSKNKRKVTKITGKNVIYSTFSLISTYNPKTVDLKVKVNKINIFNEEFNNINKKLSESEKIKFKKLVNSLPKDLKINSDDDILNKIKKTI